MHLTSPLFTFLFLPLSLLPLPLCPPKYRKACMLVISLLFFLLANLQNPLGYLQIGFVVILICLLACVPGDTVPRLRLWIGIGLPLAILVAARICAELLPHAYAYPFGLGLVCLGGISLSIDRYRSDAPECDNPLSVISYLLLFPVLSMGPLLRYKQYLHIAEKQAPSFAAFSRGATLYMIGYLKRIAVASLLLFSLQGVLSVMQDGLLPPAALLLALFLSYFVLYFAVSGTTDMARGLLSIYGLSPTRGQGRFFSAISPDRMLGALLISLDRFLEDYVGEPIRHRLPHRTGKCVASVLVLACTLLFYRMHPAVLLVGAPLFLSAVLAAGRGRYAPLPCDRHLRPLLCVLSAALLSLFSLCIMLEDPFDIFRLLSSFFRPTKELNVYHLLVSLSYRHYLMLLFPLFALIMPLYRYANVWRTRIPQRVVRTLRFFSALMLFVAFLLTIVYLLPQFPQYTDLVYRALPL